MSATKKQIAWDNLAGILEGEFAEGRVVLTGLEGGDLPVKGFGRGSLDEYVTLHPYNHRLTRDSYLALYPHVGLAYLEPGHPQGLHGTSDMSKGEHDMSTTKKQITWDDLKDIPAEDFAAGRVAVTGLVGGDVPVTGLDFKNCYAPYLTVAPSDATVYKGTFNALGLGLVREVEEHPTPIPDEAEYVAIHRRTDGSGSLEDRCPDIYWSGEEPWTQYVQALAAEHGFEVLVPSGRVAEAREEGRLAGIREVYEKYGPLRVIDGAGRLSYYLEHAYSAEMFEEGDR